MSKIKKIIAAIFLSLTLCGSILPSINNFSVYADSTQLTNTIINNEPLKNINKKISKQEFYKIIDVGVKQYNLDYEESERLTYIVYKDNLSFNYITPRAAFWTEKGLTVEGAAFIINTALSLALGGGFKLVLQNLYKNKNKAMLAQVSRVVKRKLIEAGAGAMATFVSTLISTVMFVLDPGMSIAQRWDAQDAYPNNGHINF